MVALLVSLVLASGTAGGAPPSDCLDYGSTPAACESLWKQEEATERALNATYRRLLARLDAASTHDVFFRQAKTDLIEAQRAWVVFREKDCDARGGVDRGLQLRSGDCKLDRARQRIRELEDIDDALGALDVP